MAAAAVAAVALTILAVPASAQITNPMVFQATSPSGSCTVGPPLFYNYTNGALYGCDNGTWTAISGGGGGSFTQLSGDAISGTSGGATTINFVSVTTLPAAGAAIVGRPYRMTAATIGGICPTAGDSGGSALAYCVSNGITYTSLIVAPGATGAVTLPGTLTVGNTLLNPKGVSQSFATACPSNACAFDLATANSFQVGALTADVTSVTFSHAATGQIFAVTWLQDGTGGRKVTQTATNTCQPMYSAGIYTTQFYQGQADGTVKGIGCVSNSNTSVLPLSAAPTGTVPTGTLACWPDVTTGMPLCQNNAGQVFGGPGPGVSATGTNQNAAVGVSNISFPDVSSGPTNWDTSFGAMHQAGVNPTNFYAVGVGVGHYVVTCSVDLSGYTSPLPTSVVVYPTLNGSQIYGLGTEDTSPTAYGVITSTATIAMNATSGDFAGCAVSPTTNPLTNFYAVGSVIKLGF